MRMLIENPPTEVTESLMKDERRRMAVQMSRRHENATNGVKPIGNSPGRDMEVPDPETPESPKRRTYTADYKKRILEEIDSFTKPGQMGALLRREGLYSSTVSNWRKQRDGGLSPRKRGPKPRKNNPLNKQIQELERRNRNLQKKLDRANLLLDIQKKISELTGIPQVMTGGEEEDL